MITLHGEEVKVGDRVWHLFQGWGEVIAIDDKRDNYPICVRWEEDYEWFTKDGKANIDAETPTLFWQPIEFEIPKKPEQKPKEKAWQWVCKQARCNHFYLTSEFFATREEVEASGADGYGYYEVVEPYLPSEIEREGL